MTDILPDSMTGMVASSPFGVFLLPGGYVDDEKNVHKEVEVTELTGEEEDILASRQASSLQKINKALTNCIKRVGTISEREKIEDIVSNKLTSSDRMFLLIGLRRVSLGDDYPFEVTCPCEKKVKMRMVQDLSETMTVEPEKDPLCRNYTVELRDGKKAICKVMTGEDEAKRDRMKSQASKDKLTLAILLRVVELDGKPANLRSLKKLGSKDRNALRSAFTKHEVSIGESVPVTCNQCDREFNVELEFGQPDFFFPSGEEDQQS